MTTRAFFRIQLGGPGVEWRDVSDTYLGHLGYLCPLNRDFGTVEAARIAIARTNKQIREGYYEYCSVPIQPGSARITRHTVTVEIEEEF